jgi:alpha-2-macroglobulin
MNAGSLRSNVQCPMSNVQLGSVKGGKHARTAPASIKRRSPIHPSTHTPIHLFILSLCVLCASVAVSDRAGAAPVREVNLWVARDAAPAPRVRLTLNTQNVPVVRMAAYRLDGISWLIRRDHLAEAEGEPKQVRPKPAGKAVQEWDVRMNTRADRPQYGQSEVYRSRQVNLPALSPGVYLLTAAGGAKEAWAVVNITHLAVVLKRSPRKLLAWVTDHKTGVPVRSARVGLYALDRRRVAVGATGADGACQLPTSPAAEQTVVVEWNKDMAGIPTAVENPDGILKMHFQTDRPIYRPGHTVHFKAILRRTADQGYAPVAKTRCKVEVRDSKDNAIETMSVETSSVGTLSGSVELPPEGVTGPYTVAVSAGNDTVYGTFSVAEYRKPEFKVTVKPAQKRYLAGEPAEFELEAAYYFGAPLPQAQVTYQIRRSENPYADFDPSGRWFSGGDGNLYPRDTYGAEPFVAEGTVFTDEGGRVRIPFKTDKAAPDSTYTVQCTVQDAGRRQVEASASVPVYAAAIRLSLRSDLLLAPLGSVVPLELKAVDLDGKPASARVALSVKHPVWVEKEGRYVYKELTRTEVAIPAAGKASATVPAKVQGDLLIEATALDPTGRKTSARYTIWVVSPDYKPQKEPVEPTLTVRLDRRTYRPGETARVWVSANTRTRPILVTLEGEDLWQYAVVPAGKGTLLWNVKTDLRMSPNAYVGACQWAGSGLLSANSLLPLPDPSRQLTVKIEPDRASYRPGDPATYIVRTLDAKGRPVSAEVSLAVVDEAIFAVRPDGTPDPYAHFWGLRQNLTLTAYSAPEEVSGGAYQRNNALAPVRQRFLDTAYWNAHVITGADGTGRVTFEFPGNLTAWRATTLAVTTDTQVGRTLALVQVSRPVMLRLAVPRLIVAGDRITLAGTVHNRTEQDREFETRILVEGLRVEGETMRRVRVPAGGEGTVEWKLVSDGLPSSAAATIQGTAVAADAPAGQRAELSDALRVGVRVVPKGIAQRITVGGTLEEEKTVSLTLPEDRIEPATTVTLSVRAGLRQVVEEAARYTLNAYPYGSLGAANHLLLSAAAPNLDAHMVRDALALLSRFQKGEGGWGWWDEDPSDPLITARVLAALAVAKEARQSIPETLLQRGIAGAVDHYNETNLWEHRALLAAATALAGDKEAPKRVEEVQRRGTHLSPYARLALAQALAHLGKDVDARALADEVMKGAVTGPEFAYVPAGERPGWSATTIETTTQALVTLVGLRAEPELQRKLAGWLAQPEEEASYGYRSQDDQARIAWALAEYIRAHPEPVRTGEIEVRVNGTPVEVPPMAEEKPFRLSIPRALFKDGPNTLTLKREGRGEVFFAVEAHVYRPAVEEASEGLRVLRRWEKRNSSGIWVPLIGPVKPSDAIRVTVVVWPEEGADAIRVSQPIPAGFEFVESEEGAWAREEVRDGAVIHYLRGGGRPLSFRYYLRAESEGELVALPAVGEVLRRPSVRGHSSQVTLSVREPGLAANGRK